MRISGNEFMKALQTSLQLMHRRGVRDANMPVRAERFAGHHRDVRFGQQSLSELHRAGDAVLAQRDPDVGIGVERPLGLGAAYAGYGPKSRNHEVPPFAILS